MFRREGNVQKIRSFRELKLTKEEENDTAMSKGDLKEEMKPHVQVK